MSENPKSLRTRGTAENPPNRFEQLVLERDEDWNPEDDPLPRTQFLKDTTQTIIAYNNSPDIGFETSVNPYRGCEHGCIYCYARPFHEYLGFSSGLDFETKIMVKENAPALLRAELSARKWKPQVIMMSGVTDCYQPIERKLKLTRGCLEVLAEFRNPVGLITKNALVTRDIDVLSKLAEHHAATVFISLTTLDSEIRKVMEPRTSPPEARLAAIQKLSAAGIPTGVNLAPMIPGLTDSEIPSLIRAAVEGGAKFAGYVPLRLPHSVAPLFEHWLQTHFPDRKDNVLNRIRAMRGGKLYQSNFGERMSGEGIFAEQMEKLFEVACRKYGIAGNRPNLSTAGFRKPGEQQLELI
ncbi:MAG TPA: PA0069 family radical SAM protein [Verrucomicrobiae bacterium]